LVITAIDFISLYSNPLKLSLGCFHRYESKLLRDLKCLLQCEGIAAEEVIGYVEDKSHPRL
jgi:hypothetical protein